MLATYPYTNRKAPLGCRREGPVSVSFMETPMSKISRAAIGADVFSKIAARTIVVADEEKHGPLGACWLWNGVHGGRTPRPMVHLPRFGGEKTTAVYVARLVLERKIGRPLSSGEIAQHDCDNPNCVRPDHLVVGTNATNTADMVAKGRQARGARLSAALIGKMARGEKHHYCKFTDAQVVAVRTASGTHREIGERFGISRGHVSNIKSGKYRSVPT